jgi:hypothetical protein
MGALLFVSACEVVLGLDGAVSSYDDLLFCSCGALVVQDGLVPTSEKFTVRCETAIDLATKAQFDDFIALECNTCPSAISDLGNCYATLTKAADVGEPCETHADCRSMVCCANGGALVQDGGTCCDQCAGCSTVDDAGNAAEVCVDLAQRLAVESCDGCNLACNDSLTLIGLRNCAQCIEDTCPAACSVYKDRPIQYVPDN